jgi:tetratricopeptide (TPR) repeat protein
MQFLKNKNIITLSVVVIFAALIVLFVYYYEPKSIPEGFLVDSELRNEITQRIPELKSKVESDPSNPDFKRDLSRAYYLTGDFSASEKLIQESINLNPENPQYYVDLGLLYEVKKDYVKAEEVYRKAVELNTKEIENPGLKNVPPELHDKLKEDFPSSVYLLPTPYLRLGDLYLTKLDKIDEAISVLEEGIKIAPDYPDFYYVLSTVYAKKGDAAKAGEYMQKFNDLISKQPAAASTPTP